MAEIYKYCCTLLLVQLHLNKVDSGRINCSQTLISVCESLPALLAQEENSCLYVMITPIVPRAVIGKNGLLVLLIPAKIVDSKNEIKETKIRLFFLFVSFSVTHTVTP